MAAAALLFAALAAGGVGVVTARGQAAAGDFDGELLIVSDPHTGPSGLVRAQARGGAGTVSLLSRTALPPAGSRVRVRAQLRRSGPELVAFLSGAPEVRVPPGPAWRLRAGLRAYLRQAAGTATEGAALLPGLVVGDTSGVGEGLDSDMKTVSLAHITAVSGANISLVSLGALALVRLATPRRGPGICAALAATGAYVFLVGPDASVLRAAAMGTVGALVLARGVGRSGVAVLCAALAALLVARPELAASAGFAMSAAATAALLVLGEPLVRLLARLRVPRLAAAALAVPVCAQAGVLPLLAAMGSAPSAWAVVLNVLAGPAVAPATVLGLAGLCCGLGSGLVLGLTVPGHGALAQVFVRPAALGADWIAGLAHVGAGLPGAALPWPPGGLGIALAAAVSLATAVIVLGRGRWRLWAAAGALLALGCGLALPRLGAGAAPPADWRVLACDVGQGSATLVRLDASRVLLVDAGKDPAALDRCLSGVRAHRVYAVISHFDADHWAGISGAVRGGRTVERVWIGPRAAADPKAARLPGLVGRAGEPIGAGARMAVGAVAWRALWPEARPASAPGAGASGAAQGAAGGEQRPAADSAARNDEALVIRVDAGRLSLLLPADIGAQEQRRLARGLEPVDVLVAPHHGSADLSADFFRAAGARAGIVSVGQNSYGHPTLQALRAFGPVAVLRTDECGSVWITDAGRLDGQRGCAAQIDP